MGQRLLSDVQESIKKGGDFEVYDGDSSLLKTAHVTRDANWALYMEHEVPEEAFTFGAERNEFEHSCQVGRQAQRRAEQRFA